MSQQIAQNTASKSGLARSQAASQQKLRSQTNSVRKPFGSELKKSFTSANKSPTNNNTFKSTEDRPQENFSVANKTESTQSTSSFNSHKPDGQTAQPKQSPKNMQQIQSQQVVKISNNRQFIVLGLKNIGNTCYMNSILQCLFASLPLSDYFLNGVFRKDYENQVRPINIGRDFFYLLNAIQNATQGQGVAVPQDLKLSISKKSSQFRSSGQQDAQEFLRCFLDQLNEELNRVTIKPPYKEENFDNLSVQEQSEGWWRYYKSRESSIIQDIFEGQLHIRTKCQLCGYESHKFDNFMDISVPVPQVSDQSSRGQSVQLDQCLQQFIKEEDMEKCGYKCNHCKKEDNFKNQMTISRFPKILVLHLKRFQYNMSWKQKLNTKIDIPKIIDMSPFAPYSNEAYSSRKNVYSIFGICHHFGSLSSGHYTAEIKTPNGRWFNCNDSIVEQIATPNFDASESAYLLFYQLIETEETFNQKL
eukprot:403357200